MSVAIVLLVAIGGMRVKASDNEGAYRELGVYSEVLSRIQTEYVEEPNIPEVTSGALHGLLESLDANSSYLSPEEYKRFRDHKAGGKATIGATLSKRYGYGVVVAVLAGGPAEKAGLNAGDIIEAIDGRSTRDTSLAEMDALLSGERGSNIEFSVVRPQKAEPQKLVITRDDVTAPQASEKMLESNIGYLKPGSFAKGKAEELAGKIKAAEKSGAKKLILDLRNVADGDELEGVAVANLFLDHGTIATLKGQKVEPVQYNADAKKVVTKLPLVVLVNRGTAGPAEIVAAAVLENGRADLVGDKTFGSGSVTKLIEIPDGSAIILSVAKYYSPGGKAIQDSAVTPNIIVADELSADMQDDGGNAAASGPDTGRKTEKPTDDQLDRAVQVAKNKTS